MINKFLSFLILLTLFNITLFAGEATATGTPKTYYLKDTKQISGVHYQCKAGTLQPTDSNGKVTFDNTCSEITFSLNNKVILGKIAVQDLPNSDDKIFITDLFGTSRIDTNSVHVRNVARLLQSLDDDQNPLNGINLITSQINSSNDINLSIWQSDTKLQSIVQQQYAEREIVSDLCAVVHLEEALRDNSFYVDTVSPCTPKLAYDILATSNNKSYIELIGERNSTIWLNGVNTTMQLDQDGRFYDFELNTTIKIGKFNGFDIIFADATGKKSDPYILNIFSDTDQPLFIENNITIKAPNKLVTMNITDDSVTLGGLTLEYEILGGVNQNLFTINSDGKIEFKNNSTPGTYQVQVKVKDKANHYDIKDVNITVIP